MLAELKTFQNTVAAFHKKGTSHPFQILLSELVNVLDHGSKKSPFEKIRIELENFETSELIQSIFQARPELVVIDEITDDGIWIKGKSKATGWERIRNIVSDIRKERK